MKGIVFTEFMDMVEDKFSDEMLDTIIEEADLPNDGAYTAVGTYDHEEIVRMAVSLSKHTEIPIPTLLNVFGEHLFGRFADLYPRFFEGVTSSKQFLSGVDNYIHVEVYKLYPDAELPKFDISEHENGDLEMVYRSSRHFQDLAVGLITGCLKHFGDEAELGVDDRSTDEGSEVAFTLHFKQTAEA